MYRYAVDFTWWYNSRYHPLNPSRPRVANLPPSTPTSTNLNDPPNFFGERAKGIPAILKGRSSLCTLVYGGIRSFPRHSRKVRSLSFASRLRICRQRRRELHESQLSSRPLDIRQNPSQDKQGHGRPATGRTVPSCVEPPAPPVESPNNDARNRTSSQI